MSLTLNQPRHRRALTLLYVLWLVVSLGAAWGQGAQRLSPTEYQVRAAFLYNFAKFVTWDDAAFEGTMAPVVIGVAGRDPFDKILEVTVRNNKINGRPIEIRAVTTGPEASKCHLLYFGEMDAAARARLINAASRGHTLTVGENEEFAKRDGGMIAFDTFEKRVVFVANRKPIRESKLKVSSKLLAVAKEVLE